MVTGAICPRCGRSGTGENITTQLDILTQSAYLITDGYIFQNPHWSMRRLPEPEFWEELQDDLHKEVKPIEGKSLIQTNYFRLYRFKLRWIFTDRILAQLPYAVWDKNKQIYTGRDWIKQSTFLLPPNNDPEPDFTWCEGSIVARWKNAGYVWEEDEKLARDNPHLFGQGKWVIKNKGEENPDAEEIMFLKHTEKLLAYYKNEYTHKREIERNIYNETFLAGVKQELDDNYDSETGKWGRNTTLLNIDRYKELRLIFEREVGKLAHHIERKIDYKRTGLELYKPISLTKVNDSQMIIEVERDFMAENYNELLRLWGCWKFQTWPLTKEIIENFSKDARGRNRPLQSCVFCPGDDNSATGKSDDWSFDRHILIRHPWHGEMDMEKYREQAEGWLADIRRENNVQDSQTLADNIQNILANDRTLRKEISNDNLKSMQEALQQASMIDGLDPTTKSRLEKQIKTIEREFSRRDNERRKIDNEKIRHQNQQNTIYEQRQRTEENIRRDQEQLENSQRNQERYERELAENINRREQVSGVFATLTQNQTKLADQMANLNQNIITGQRNLSNSQASMQAAAQAGNVQQLNYHQDQINQHSQTLHNLGQQQVKLQGEINSANYRIQQHQNELNQLEHQGRQREQMIQNCINYQNDISNKLGNLRNNLDYLDSRQDNLQRDVRDLDERGRKMPAPLPFVPIYTGTPMFPSAPPPQPTRPRRPSFKFVITRGNYWVSNTALFWGHKTETTTINGIEEAKRWVRRFSGHSYWFVNDINSITPGASDSVQECIQELNWAIEKCERGENVDKTYYT